MSAEPTPSSAAPGGSSAPSQLVTLLRLAWPIVVARATQSVIGFTDALLVAPLGEAELAAATTGALDTFALIVLPMGTVFIVQSFAAQLRGRGEHEAVVRYGLYGLLLAALAGLFALAAAPFVPAIVGMIDTSPEVRARMSEYIAIRLYSVFGAVGIEALGNYYSGLGNTRPAMVAGVIAMVGNVALNLVLIEPHFGLPGYGVAGSAWASTIATFVGFFVILARFVRDARAMRGGTRLTLRLSEFTRMLRFGLPNGVNWFLEFGSFALFINLVVGHLGTTALAAFNIVMQVNSVSFMPAFGFASAGAIIVGETIGRGAFDEVKRTVKLTATITCSYMGAQGLIYFVWADELMHLFAPRDRDAASLMATGASMLVLASVWQLFDGVGLTLGEALRAAGDTTWCMFARVALGWFVFLPLGYAIVWQWGGGPHEVMYAIFVYVALIASALFWRFQSGRWRKISLLGEPDVLA